MINPSSAPKSPNPMPAGLGALTQMGPTPRGKSPSNMGQVMAMARKLSDMQLSDVLKGLSLAVPQFAAMTEAMGRKSLRNAMQGAEAQMQAKAPNLKDKLLAEESAQQMPTMPGMAPQTVMAAGGGLTSIPAPNMESMDMASGGIIAFAGGGSSMAGFETSEEELLADELRRRKLVEERGGRIREDGTVENAYANLYGTKPPPAPVVPSTDAQMNADQGRPGVAVPRTNAAAPRPAANGGGGSPVVTPGLPADLKFDPSEFDQKYKTMFGETPKFNKRNNPYYSMKYEGEDPRKVREEGIGFGLMKAGQALLKNPTFAGGLGDAIGAFGDQGWLTAKELKAAKKDERDYNFNMAKASELFEQGQEDKALQYAKIGQDKEKAVAELTLNAFKAKVDTFKANTDKFSAEQTAAYQKMMASKPDAGLAMLDRIMKDNKGMSTLDALSAISGAKNPKYDSVSKDKALEEWEKMSSTKRAKFFDDFDTYFSSVNTKGLSATIPQGAVVRPS